jgi:rod shape-determining protein MreC
MVTSGNGGLYTPNIPVAVVTEKTADGAIANVLSNPAATDYVAVQPRFIPLKKEEPSEDEAQGTADKTANGDDPAQNSAGE